MTAEEAELRALVSQAWELRESPYLRDACEAFPEIVDETIASLAVAATLLLEDQQNPVPLNYEGAPSSQKTTLVDFYNRAGDKVYRSDKFTPKAFVSHAASISRERLNEID